MRYFKHVCSDGTLVAVGTGCGGTEITEIEYNTLLAEIREKASLVEQLYSGTITIDAVPTSWQEEIQRRANELPPEPEPSDTDEITGDEAMAIILGGAV